jgi:hypothetical protein
MQPQVLGLIWGLLEWAPLASAATAFSSCLLDDLTAFTNAWKILFLHHPVSQSPEATQTKLIAEVV